MKGRWGIIIGLVAAAVAFVPLATAGAQAPTTTGGEVATAPEGSVPPGGDVACDSGAALSPDHGPPGTVVTVTATFQGNCDDIVPSFFQYMTCSGQYLVEGHEQVAFDMEVDSETGVATGSFVAPVTEPNPPVVDAIEPITVTVSCTVEEPLSPEGEGSSGGTTYTYPASLFDLELFAEHDRQQPTLVEDDEVVQDGGVVAATPTFTG